MRVKYKGEEASKILATAVLEELHVTGMKGAHRLLNVPVLTLQDCQVDPILFKHACLSARVLSLTLIRTDVPAVPPLTSLMILQSAIPVLDKLEVLSLQFMDLGTALLKILKQPLAELHVSHCAYKKGIRMWLAVRLSPIRLITGLNK